MADATFKHGEPGMVDHTPSGDVSAGDVIAFDGGFRIAHRDITADTLGALADGGGVYEMTCATGVTASDGELAYWNASTGVTRTVSDDLIGRFVKAKVSGELVAWVRHFNTQAT